MGLLLHKKKYNILYTTSFNYMMGGGQWSLYYLIKHLNKESFHPIVLCPEEGKLSEKMRGLGADVVYLNIGRIRHMNLFVVLKLISIIKKHGINIVHTDSTTETFYAGIAVQIMRIPLVWHIRVSESAGHLDRLLSLLSDRLILVAKALSSRFKWLEGSSKLAVVHNAVDLEEFDSFTSRSSIRKEFGIRDSEIVLVCIGRIEERKGQEYLVNAMKHVDNARLVIIGKKNEVYFKKLKEITEEYGLSDRIIFTGHRKDIPSILREIDIMVMPTFTEGFSRVILEAMATGKPVIATDVGGTPEAVIDGVTGYIVPTRDSLALTNRINELVNDGKKREEMGRAGRTRVEEKFSMKDCIKKVEGIYSGLLRADGNERREQ